MEIRDPIHGPLIILDEERPLIKGAFFSRLRNIKQLGFSEYIFPGAVHTRFLHSIGVMHIGTSAFDRVMNHLKDKPQIKRLRETFRLACLLHDIGHAPLSHATESAMPKLADLQIPPSFLAAEEDIYRQATHEDYTVKAIADSSLSICFKEIEKIFKIERKFIVDIITGRTKDNDYFTVDGLNYFPILHQLISSEMDCDRMDYLLRDSYFCGVSYGKFDLPWLLDNLVCCPVDGKVYLGISERAVITFDDFLISRYHMFIMVYFHYRPVCLEQLLYKYFKTSPSEYQIPEDIEKYIEHDDYYLKKIIKKSKNPYAKELIENRIPPKIYEAFNKEQRNKIHLIEMFLKEEGIDYIRCSSEGRLSKYYTAGVNLQNYPIKVVRTTMNSSISYSNIEDVTKLFYRFSKAHVIERIHCHWDQLRKTQKRNLNELINT